MASAQLRVKAVLDIECYVNYFLIALKNIANRKVVTFERSDWADFDVEQLKLILAKYTIVTFNGKRYDELMLKAAIRGASNKELKQLSDDIIANELKPWHAETSYRLPTCTYIDHVDLIEVAPGKASLKIYGGRLHSKRMQDLPIQPDAVILDEDRPKLSTYCVNDLDTTIDLYCQLDKQIALREDMSKEYGIDLRSKSDAQMAEAVIKKQIEAIKGERVYRPEFPSNYAFKYKAPKFVKFTMPEFQRALDVFTSVTFTLNEKGDVAEPEEVGKLKVAMGNTIYQLGIGGIHSCEKSVVHVAGEDCGLYDRDVTSYYPNIILGQGLSPEHLGSDFLSVYRSIVERRIKAKRSGDKVTDAALKITINGSFGKFGSKWSALYGPNLLIQTTVTGQLALLMLIEQLEVVDIPVVSANTDGIVVKCPSIKRSLMLERIEAWEKQTGFGTEETAYAALYSRDINNYIALKPDGNYKVKGAYADPNLSKTPANQICVKAVIDYLQFDIPIEMTVRRCKDIKQFVTVRAVTGGAVKGDVYLGKAVRWYYAVGESGAITYKKNGNKVPRSDGAKPVMELPDVFPDDVDHAWYISEAKSIMSDLGIKA